jgi:hypothetical protein
VLPSLPIIAALSAGHLAALVLPSDLRRLYAARDLDRAGTDAVATLIQRAGQENTRIMNLDPRSEDFNNDLRQFGPANLAAWVHVQLAIEDVANFLGTGTA